MKSLGIDIGTTSISFAVMEGETRTLIKSRTIANRSFVAARKAEEKLQDPELIWQDIRQVLATEELSAEGISAIGLTGQMHGMLYTDAAGEAVSPLYTWEDASAEQIYQNGETYVQRLSRITGYQMATGFGAATFYTHTLQHLVPRQAVSFCTIMDYIGMKLTGRRRPLMDATNAAGYGLFKLRQRCFDREAIARAGLKYELFPRLAGAERRLGKTPDGIPVAVAIGDNQASFLGAVKDHERSILVNVGTGSQISLLTPHYCETAGMETRPFIGDSYLLVKSSLCGGRAYALLADFFAQVITGYRELAPGLPPATKEQVYTLMENSLAQYQKHPPTAEPLLIEPLFCGTREEPERRGSIRNMSIDNFTPGAFTDAMLRGIIRELYEAYTQCTETLRAGKDLVIGSGNGLRKNSCFQAITQEMFGKKFQLSENMEEAAAGAALNIFLIENKE